MSDRPPGDGAGRPWWSSGAPPPPPGGQAGAGQEDTGQGRPGYEHLFEQVAGGAHDHHTHGDDQREPEGVQVDTCQICPICAVMRMAGEVRPEVLVHLSEAARHLTLAAKIIVDAQASGFSGRGVEHIPLDDDPPPSGTDDESP